MSTTTKYIEYRLMWPNGQEQGRYSADEINDAHKDLMNMLRAYSVPSEYFPKPQACVITIDKHQTDWMPSSQAEHIFREGSDAEDLDL